MKSGGLDLDETVQCKKEVTMNPKIEYREDSEEAVGLAVLSQYIS